MKPIRARVRALATTAVLAVAVCFAFASRTQACGVSGPDGVWSCSIAEHDEEIRPRWSLGAVSLYSASALRFRHGPHVEIERAAVLGLASYAPTARLRLQLSAGASISGQLNLPNGAHDFLPGPTGALAVSYRFLEDRPFVILSGVLSAFTARTQRRADHADSARYTAFDLRLGVAVGATFFEMLSPYAVARVFGGPVFWRYQGKAIGGTDVYHFQLGAGTALRLWRRLDVFVEGAVLGEIGLSGGAAFVF
jgi:hypothetical protein